MSTLRQAQTGLWAQYDLTELATPQAFLRHSYLLWDWYAYRRQIVVSAQPNLAHYALVIMQNMDGLHWRAGSRGMHDLPGNIDLTRCFGCSIHVKEWYGEGKQPPRYGDCGGLLRPDVVWFGEGLPEETLRMAAAVPERFHAFLAIVVDCWFPYHAGELLPILVRQGIGEAKSLEDGL